MKVESLLFGTGALFFAPVAVVYGFITSWEEPVGTAALLLSAGLSLLIGLYLFVVSRRIGLRPEDDPDGEIRQGAGEQGHFFPHSWWPLVAGAAATVVFAGLAIGWWLFLIGVGTGLIALFGWSFEYYRGINAH
jgi:hypothetical protein